MDRDTAGGLVMLIGLGIIARGIWEMVAGTPGGGETLIVGIVLLFGGFLFVGWPILFAGTAEPAPKADAPAPAEAAEPAEAAQPAPEEDTERTRFSVIQTGDDDHLDRIAPLLSADPRVTGVGWDTGRWYSVPDGDDLPEWFALRVSCKAGDTGAVMDDLRRRIRDELGPATSNAVNISEW